jgi:hypothetical protein
MLPAGCINPAHGGLAVIHPRRSRRTLPAITLAFAAFLLPPATAASASTVTLECGGKGARSKDSSGTILCAAQPGKARIVAGVVRDDGGRPVATAVTVTFSKWTPSSGGGYTVRRGDSRTINSKADGSFSLPVKTATRVSLEFGVADEAKGVSPAAAAAEVSRQLAIKVKNRGGGKVKVTVGGLEGKRAKVYVLDQYGYEISGVGPRRTDGKGRATFNLGSRRGKFEVYVDVGIWTDLYWYGRRPSFRL